MTRFKALLAVLFAAALVALVAGVPVAQAQSSICPTGSLNVTNHYIGGGSSAQFIMAAIAADQAAIECNAAASTAGTIKHWSKKFNASSGDGGRLIDTRHSGIADQTGNIWIVWIEEPAGTATDVWLDVSVDSTVGVRCALAKASSSSQGCQANVTSANNTISDKVINTNLWPDGNTTDANLDLAAINDINAGGGAYVNVGLTDIRPEDAAEATARLLCTATGTPYKCLGDTTSTTGIGGNIWTGQGTSSFAQPVSFGLPGEKDPFSSLVVPTSFVTYPIGAAPVVFIGNNGGTAGNPWNNPNLVSGVTPTTTDTANGQIHPLANLFDGSSNCDTSNIAFGGSGVGTTDITVFEREPLSGTMNTTEFSVFRSAGNSTDSQEIGWHFPSVNGGVGTTATCLSGGDRSRAIGTSEVVGSDKTGAVYGVIGTPNSIGYIFTGWGNLSKFGGSTTPPANNFQYFTVDGIDPIFGGPGAYSTCTGGVSPNNDGAVCGTLEPCTASGTGTAGTCTGAALANQEVPNCTTNLCSQDLWESYPDPNGVFTIPAGITYPNVRNGQYPVWSIYRWVAQPTTDAYGPSLVAQEAQNFVDGDVADFVPFEACNPGSGNSCFTTTGPTDGLDVYHSHFNTFADTITYKCPAGSTNPDNGAKTAINGTDNGNTLGGNAECGGDVGGDIIGPFGNTWPSVTWAKWTSVNTLHKGHLLTPIKYAGQAFSTTHPATGTVVNVWCTDNTGTQHEYNTTVEINSAGKIYLTLGNPLSTLDQSIACKIVDPVWSPATAVTPGTTKEKQ